MRKSSRSVSVGFGLLLLVSAVLSSACPGARSGEDDRPVIIISSGSVTVDVTPAAWTAEDGRGKRYLQKDSDGKKWKSVKSYLATTGTCTVAGEKLSVTYGDKTILLDRKKSWLFGKRNSQVQFPDDADVKLDPPNLLTVSTTEALAKVTNGGTGSGNECDVVAGRIEIQQKH